MQKPVVLAFVPYYLPAYKSGGPVRTIANMVEMLGDQLDFRIVTSDRDAREINPFTYITVQSWNLVGKALVYYVDRNKLTLGEVRRLILNTPHDILYLNSFLSYHFTQKPILTRKMYSRSPQPAVIAPRGEFSQGALAIKRLKKQLYLRLVKMIGLYRNITWQASSEFEADDIRRTMGSTAKKIIIAPDLPTISTIGVNERDIRLAENEKLKIVFVARISPKKNLDLALQVLSQITIPVQFNIYGSVSDQNYWRQCQEFTKNMPSNIEVCYHGVVEHAEVFNVLAENDLYFLPTHGENYGHSIIEALMAGVPVLISDQTPWQDLDHAGVGWVRSLDDIEAYKEIIEQFAMTEVSLRMAQRERSRNYATKVAKNSTIKEQNLQLFLRQLR